MSFVAHLDVFQRYYLLIQYTINPQSNKCNRYINYTEYVFWCVQHTR